MKIYLAGSCGSESRTMMVGIAKLLRVNGYEVYCPFELKIENAWDYTQEDWARMVFERDIMEIESCDLMISISPGRVGTAGTNWEQGYAYAKEKKIWVFQYTEENASLMTYCGSSLFVSCKTETLFSEILYTLNKEPTFKENARVILT